MKKFALLAALLSTLGLSSSSFGGVSCSVPFNLQNGTVADATQVMANYNAIIACLGNAAAAGANGDITSLNALNPPLPPNAGGTQSYTGGGSTGTANAQVVNPTIPANFSLVLGRQVTFLVGQGNTGPTTLNIAGTGAVPVFRRTQLGTSPMVGGELITGQAATVVYDGTRYQFLSGDTLVGQIMDWPGVTAPPGWALLDGSCQDRATFADLFSVIGTAYDPGGLCSGTQFALPDGRGRVLVGRDNMGGGAVGRLTLPTCNGTVLGGAGCGAQTFTLASGNLPTTSVTGGSVSFTSASISVSLSGGSTTTTGAHTHTFGGGVTNTYALTGSNVLSTASNNAQGASAAMDSAGDHSHGLNGTGSFNQNLLSPTYTAGSIGSATPTAVPNIPPLQVVNKIIKY